MAAALIVFGLPWVSGASWSDIWAVLSSLALLQLAVLTVVWLLGLALQTIALAAALPGLSHRRAFFLNITGSSVSNLLPLGGAAGTVVNYLACRDWGFTTAAFVRWILVTNIWDVLGRLAIPGIALAWFAASDLGYSEALAGAAIGASVLLAVLAALTVLLVGHDAGARGVGSAVEWLVERLRRSRLPRGAGWMRGARRPSRPEGWYAGRAVAIRRSIADLVASAWMRLTVGKALYALFQALLLWLCLDFLGEPPPLVIAFAAFAAERVLSLAVITPGATGIVELGMVGFLVRMGTDPAAAAGAVLLYRFFVVGMEIPVGGAGLLWWFARRVPSRSTRAEVGARPLSRVTR